MDVDLVRGALGAARRTSTQAALYGQALAARLGIGATDLECLALLQELGPSSAGQLAELLGLTTGAVTGIVDRLEAGGFVLRESDPDDRRRVIVRPLPERLADLDRGIEPLLQAAACALDGWSEGDLRLATDFQQRLADVLRQQTARLKTVSSEGANLSAALGTVSAGTLEFATGSSNLRICAGEDSGELYRASFEGAQPNVRVQDGAVVFRYRRMSPFDWGKHAGTVALNRAIPWSIELRGGASRVALDLRGGRLRELAIRGGASHVDVLLPRAAGTVPVRVEGGVSRLRILRPEASPAQLEVRGGANRLEFDGQRFGAIGGELRLAGPGWDAAEDRYDIAIAGGASRLEIDTQGEEA